VFEDGVIHLVASNIPKGNARGVLGHEAWHAALEALKFRDSPEYQKLMGRLATLEKLAGKRGKVHDWFDRGRERIPEDTPAKDRLNELATYAIEEYESAPRSLPQAIAQWGRDFLADIRAFIFDKTGHLPDKLTVADLSAIAQRFLRSATIRENLMVRASLAEAMTSQASVDEATEPESFRETEWAYSGKPAYEKAKAAGRTKLNYRQWVRVRTKAFK
jgi:hypothetical protein